MVSPSTTRRSLLLATALISVTLAAAAVPGAAGTPGKPVELTGTLEIVHGDQFGEHGAHAHGAVPDHVLPNMQYWLNADGKRLLLEFPGYPPQAQGGTRVTVQGERHGDAIHVSSMQTAAAAGGNGGGKGKPPKPPTTAYLGVRDLIVIPFTFAAQGAVQPWTVEEIRTSANSVSNFFAENSFGKTTLKGKNDGLASDVDLLPGDVSSWVTINASTSSCSYSTWSSAAQTLVKDAGWDLTGYEHIAHVFPHQPVCNFSGIAQLPGTQTWMNGTISPGVISHELGHNMTLYHARSLTCTGSDGAAVTLSNSCTYSEYGDPFDTMGRARHNMHFNVRNKGRLSWMTGSNLATAVSGQTYTIFPQELGSSGLQLLRVPRTSSEFFYIEARTAYGFDATPPTNDVLTGALIHTGADPATTGNSYVLDTAPYPVPPPTGYTLPPEFLDAALQPGEAFVDTRYGISIETISDNADGSVTVLVKTGVTNTTPTADPGGGHPLVTNLPHTHDGATAGDSTKNLSSYQWSWALCPGTCPALTGTEGQLSGGTDSVPGPAFTPTTAGTHRLSLTVWDATGAKTTVTADEVATGP